MCQVPITFVHCLHDVAGGLSQCDIEIKHVPMSRNPRSSSNTDNIIVVFIL